MQPGMYSVAYVQQNTQKGLKSFGVVIDFSGFFFFFFLA